MDPACQAHLDGFGRRQVTASGVVIRRTGEGGFGDQEVRPARCLRHPGRGARVRRVDEGPAGEVLEPHPPGRQVVLAGNEADLEAAGARRTAGVVLMHLEGLGQEAGALADGAAERVQVPHAARREEERHAAGVAVGAPGEGVAQRRDVEEVVGMDMADDHRVEVRRPHQPDQPCGHAGPAVEQERVSPGADEQARRRPVGLRLGRAAAEDHQLEPVRGRRAGRWGWRDRRRPRGTPCRGLGWGHRGNSRPSGRLGRAPPRRAACRRADTDGPDSPIRARGLAARMRPC